MRVLEEVLLSRLRERAREAVGGDNSTGHCWPLLLLLLALTPLLLLSLLQLLLLLPLLPLLLLLLLLEEACD